MVIVHSSTSPWVHLFEIQCTQTHFDRLGTRSCCRDIGKLRLLDEEFVCCGWSDTKRIVERGCIESDEISRSNESERPRCRAFTTRFEEGVPG